MFKREFLTKYFPAYVRNRKVIEFMKLKQGNMSVANYAAKFESLCRFSPHYNTVEAEEDKCVKFESGLRPDIKQLIGFTEICNFATLVNKSRICDDDGRAKSNYFKAVNEKRGKNHEGKCLKCGKLDHSTNECKKTIVCYNCKEEGYKSNVCKKPRAAGGKVIALSGDAGDADNLIR
ncbi:cellular nucleic acid-binding protein, partial [Trifolium medium]|nr:cellular nucleic acid-binding protein [Trifolium medium]